MSTYKSQNIFSRSVLYFGALLVIKKIFQKTVLHVHRNKKVTVIKHGIRVEMIICIAFILILYLNWSNHFFDHWKQSGRAYLKTEREIWNKKYDPGAVPKGS